MKKKILILSLLLLGLSCNIEKRIANKPIIFDEEREQLTREYLLNHYGLNNDSTTIVPKMIVLHWTTIPTLEGSFEAFRKAILPSSRPDITSASSLNVSSHFLVDRDGSIYRLMPETKMARHVIGLNHCAIGVENVGGNSQLPLTGAQLRANIRLVKYLNSKYDIDYAIGHYEYTNFENHELWLEQDKGYRTLKTDPGEDFMKRFRRATKKLNFKQVPQ